MGCCINVEKDNDSLPEETELASKAVPGTWGEYIPSDEEDSQTPGPPNHKRAKNSKSKTKNKIKTNNGHDNTRKQRKNGISQLHNRRTRERAESVPTNDSDDDHQHLDPQKDNKRKEKRKKQSRWNQRKKAKEDKKRQTKEIEMERLRIQREREKKERMMQIEREKEMERQRKIEEEKQRILEEERRQKRIKMEKRANKRRHAMKELLDTEQTYVGLLKTLIEVFVDPLSQKPEILENKIQNAQRILFSDIKIIYGVNTAFLGDLKKKFDESEDHTHDIFIGDDLRSFTPYFKSYQSYLNNYENASVLIQSITSKERNKYSQFNEWYDKQRLEFVAGKTLDFYLILPIQRLPRYKLCLHEIIKNTEEDHPDFEQLKKAEQAIVDVTTLCNERMKEYQSRAVVREIEEQFVSYSSCDTKLVTPSRRFIKVCHVIRFFLFCFCMYTLHFVLRNKMKN